MSELVDLDEYRDEHCEWESSEVICVKCYKRWYAIRPVGTLLKDLECKNCGQGYVIETGQLVDE